MVTSNIGQLAAGDVQLNMHTGAVSSPMQLSVDSDGCHERVL